MADFNQTVTETSAITHYDFDPDVTTTVDVAWVDMRDYDKICVSFFRTVGTSDLTFTILGNTASNGSGSDVTIKTKTLTGVQPNAVGDYTFLEVSADEIIAADTTNSGLRYVSANLSLATGTDEGVVTYVRSGAKYPQGSLTADSIA